MGHVFVRSNFRKSLSVSNQSVIAQEGIGLQTHSMYLTFGLEQSSCAQHKGTESRSRLRSVGSISCNSLWARRRVSTVKVVGLSL